MIHANHRTEVTNLLEEWAGNNKQVKNLINCLVEFLVGDFVWLKKNISKVDKETLVETVNRLKH